MAAFKELFRPGKLGGKEVRNRIVMAPMGTGYDDKGAVTDVMIDYYERRARGGVGIVVTEAATVHVSGAVPSILDFYDERFMPGMSRLAAAIRNAGALALCQLNHPGRETSARLTGHDLIAPSAIPSRPANETPKPASGETIWTIIEAYAQAAERAKNAGFDGVEFHGAHGYLICAFLSPASNKRDDEFGGDTERRARFALEILRAARRRCGPGFPLTMRISADDYMPDGLRVEESRHIAKLLEAAGADAISVSSGSYDTFEYMVQPMWLPQACNAVAAKTIREAVSIPVMVAGRINNPALANSLVAEGVADYIALGRALLSDPEFANKAHDGRAAAIMRCVACNTCIDKLFQGKPVNCIVNPRLGREAEFADGRVERAKRVVVVGGGPAGMQAAARLAQRGHSVVLHEAEPRLGGRIPLCGTPEWKTGFDVFTSQLVRQIEEHEVEVKTGEMATAQDIMNECPDAVVVATGAGPVVPEVPGLDPSQAVQAEDVLMGKVAVGHRVFIMGAGYTGVELGLVLARRGHDVTVARRSGRIGNDLGRTARWTTVLELEKKARLLPGVTYEQVIPGAIVVSKDGQHETIPFDSLVMATGFRPRVDLVEALRAIVSEVHLIGDCVKPRNIVEAMIEAEEVAARI